MAARCYTPAPASTCRPLRTPEGLCFVHRAVPGTPDVDIACTCMYGRLRASPSLPPLPFAFDASSAARLVRP